MDDTRYWLWVALVFGTGNSRAWEVLRHFDTAEEAYYALRSDEVTGLTPHEEHAVKTAHIEQADGVIEFCERNGYTITTYADAAYPTVLRSICNPPLVLFSLGRLDFLSDYLGFTIVGTRHPSEYSLRVTERIAGGLAEQGLTIVSGFAMGIDGAAHTAALQKNAPTVAVLGAGLNVNYPHEHADLKAQMAQEALLITEFFPGTRPLPCNFPIRNRILSGLSLGVLVVEAAIGSGSLITANYAAEQGRDVFCIPPADIFDRRYAGVIRYLRDGAIPAFSLNDILNEYYTTYPHKLTPSALTVPYEGKPSETAVLAAEDAEEKPAIQRKRRSAKSGESEEPETPQPSAPAADLSVLNDEQRRILSCLQEQGRMHADVLAQELEMDVSDLLLMLTELELLGFVTPLFGKLYELC